jgi:hypothetical protein
LASNGRPILPLQTSGSGGGGIVSMIIQLPL